MSESPVSIKHNVDDPSDNDLSDDDSEISHLDCDQDLSDSDNNSFNSGYDRNRTHVSESESDNENGEETGYSINDDLSDSDNARPNSPIIINRILSRLKRK